MSESGSASPSGTMSDGFDFLVARDDLRTTRVAHQRVGEPVAGEALLRVERFGFSANNITYATLGEEMGYWRFFPAPEGWGRVPVWGYAQVVESRAAGLEPGARYFGYLPMSSHLIVTPGKAGPAGFTDVAEHRAALPAVYQRYQRVEDEAAAGREDEDQDAIWRPLLMTSFGAADFLLDRELYGASAVAISSASSKTALGIAFLLRGQLGSKEVIGLTSPGNVAFCEATGYYDRVVAYDAASNLPRQPLLLVDFTADERVLGAVQEASGDRLRKVVIVGGTHWQDRERPLGGLDADADLFFLPTWIQKRRDDWGPSGFGERYAVAWSRFRPSVDNWMRLVHRQGEAGVESTYLATLEGRVDPSVGQIVELGD
jgi:Protein of unknown function (DUF2855)